MRLLISIQMKTSEEGKRDRRKGTDFERKVRLDLERDGWIVDKFNSKWNGKRFAPARYHKFRWGSTGFPDFIAFKKRDQGGYRIAFIECKVGGKLSAKEREIMLEMTSQGLTCYVAKRGENGRVQYKEFNRKQAYSFIG